MTQPPKSTRSASRTCKHRESSHKNPSRAAPPGPPSILYALPLPLCKHPKNSSPSSSISRSASLPSTDQLAFSATTRCPWAFQWTIACTFPSQNASRGPSQGPRDAICREGYQSFKTSSAHTRAASSSGRHSSR